MPQLRPHRRWIAAWLAGVLLFALWSTSSHACSRVGVGTQAASMAEMPDCDGTMAMEDDEPLRCQAHCTEDGRLTGSASIAIDLPPPLPAAGAIVAVLDGAAAQLEFAAPWPAAEGPPPGSPPIYLLLQVLRN